MLKRRESTPLIRLSCNRCADLGDVLLKMRKRGLPKSNPRKFLSVGITRRPHEQTSDYRAQR